jgi:hypothetical protein
MKTIVFYDQLFDTSSWIECTVIPSLKYPQDGCLQKEPMMSTEILTRPINYCSLERLLTKENPTILEPIMACRGDYGFDFDAAELATELITPSLSSLLDHSNITIQADDFERLYRWFCS